MLETNNQSFLIRIIEPLLVAALFFYFLILLTYNLTDYTGLHVDEAWIGLNAIQISEMGLQSLHGMNHYTGSIYSALIALAFKLNGISIFSLRLPGAIANFLGLIILAINTYQHKGKNGFWILILIILSSPGLFAFSRVAWEVCAFHLLLISIKVTIISKLIYRGNLSPFLVFTFFFVSTLGIFNHFIFISDTTAFLLSILFLNYYYLDKENHTLYKLSLLATLNLCGSIYYYLIKPRIEDIYFQQNNIVSISILLAPIFLLSFLFYLLERHNYEILFHKFIHKFLTIINISNSRFILRILISLISFILIVLLIVRYFWVFLGTISSLLPLQRILVYECNWFELAALSLFWITILIFFCLSLQQKMLRISHLSKAEFNQLIFYLYPIFTLLILPIFTWRTSSRHFLISCCWLIGFLPLISEDFLKFNTKKLLSIYLTTIFILNLITGHHILYLALSSSIQQTPSTIHFFSYRDESIHFIKQNNLLKYLIDQKLCQFKDTNAYISDPLRFYNHINNYQCDFTKIAKLEYCPTCTQPIKYHSISVDTLTP